VKVTDRSLEEIISVILRIGVIVSGVIILIGGIYFILVHGNEPALYHTFHGAPDADRSIPLIIKGVVTLRPRSVIQFGLLILIFTPVARVAFSLVGFALERDRKYVLITTIVLVTLVYGLVEGSLR
jgi:uncharacterized membrane protein